MRKWYLYVLAGLFVVAVLASVYWRLQKSEIAHAPKAAPQKLAVANIGIFSVLNPIAADKGYFKNQGLDVLIDEYDSGATSIAALLAGKADVAVAADFVGVRNMFENDQIRVLAQVSNHDVFRVIARRDKGIDQPADLRGKIIGLTRKTASEFYLGRFLLNHGLRLEQVALLDLPPADMISQLKTGRIDAVLIFEPHAYTLQQDLGENAIIWPAQGEQRALGFVYTMQPFIDAHPDILDAYVRALLDAQQFVQMNNTAARELGGRLLQYDNEYTTYIWPKFDFSVVLKQDSLLSMEEEARWIIDNRLTTQKRIPNYLDAIYFNALERAKPEAVSIVH